MKGIRSSKHGLTNGAFYLSSTASLRSKYLTGEQEMTELQTSHLLQHPLKRFPLDHFVSRTPNDFRALARCVGLEAREGKLSS